MKKLMLFNNKFSKRLLVVLLFISVILLISPFVFSNNFVKEDSDTSYRKSADTKGGFGGKIIRVTNLNALGEGSFYEAVRTKGKRIVVFEVGGIIDLDEKLITIRDPYLTVAGQTAPSPGITLVNGGVLISTHDIIVQHIRVRPGNNNRKKVWSIDALSTKSAHNVIIDHCSFSWATDENLSASGPRFQGNSPEEWRKNTSNRITFSNNIIAEGLRFSTHEYGEHSKGTLIHDNVTDVLISNNLYANNMDRNPYMKGGTSGVIVNNYIYNPGKAAIRYNLAAREWSGHSYQTGRWSIVGNVMELGPDSNKISMLDIMNGPVQIYIEDNVAKGNKDEEVSIVTGDRSKITKTKPIWFDQLSVLSSNKVKENVLANAGARPWDRDEIDVRLVKDIVNRTSKIIDNEDEVGGYPKRSETRRPFKKSDWNFKELY